MQFPKFNSTNIRDRDGLPLKSAASSMERAHSEPESFLHVGRKRATINLLIGSIVSAFCLSTRATKECFSGNSSGRDLKCEPRFHCVNKYQAGRKGLLKVILSPYLQMGTFLLFTESSLLWALELLPCSSPFPSPNLSGFSLVSESGKPWSSNKAVQSEVL